MSETILGFEFEKPVLEMEEKINQLKASARDNNVDVSDEIKTLEEKCEQVKNDVYGSLTTWQRVQIARHPKRPYTLDYIKLVFDSFVELHGDRCFADDKAIVCGMAVLEGKPVMVIGHQKGRDIAENMERNFGMANPEGYRKALRVMKLAEKFNRPIITFIDTTGAYPGIGAEERGQSEAIARNLREMSMLKVPVISVTIGEGGSGGALGIGVANRMLMLENAYYSVISPEGCAAILFHDAAKAEAAADALKITSNHLLKLGIIDDIVPEPLGGAHRDHNQTAANLKSSLLKHIKELSTLSPEKVEQDRYNKFRSMGSFNDPKPAPKKAAKSKKKN
jgi:acetyl-CoA carboxylase carboxyl transferase subunit alpha